jgi:hypothetical protein
MNLKFRLLLLLILITFQQASSQNNQASILNQKITIEAQNETTRMLLKRMEEQIHLGFSYDAKIIDSKKNRTVSFKEKTLPEIISLLFDDKVKCMVKGNNIVLYKAPGPIHPASQQSKKGTPSGPPPFSKASKTKADTSVRYFIDMIVPGSSGKDSVVRTDSIEIPASYYPKVKDNKTILLLKRDTIPKPK